MRIQKNSLLYRILEGAIGVNSETWAYQHTAPRIRFHKGRTNLCEACRHVFLWFPLNVLAHLYVVLLPFYAVFIHPYQIGWEGYLVHIAILVVVALIAVVLFSISGLNFFANKAIRLYENSRSTTLASVAEDQLQHQEVNEKKSTAFFENFFTIAGKVIVWLIRAVWNTILLFGLIPALGSLIANLYKALKDNFCPFIEIEDDAQTNEGNS